MLVFQGVYFFGFTLQKKRPQSSSQKTGGRSYVSEKIWGKTSSQKIYHQPKRVRNIFSKKKWWPNLWGKPSTSKANPVILRYPSLLRVVSGQNLGHQVSCHVSSSRGTEVQVVQVSNDHEKSKGFFSPYLLRVVDLALNQAAKPWVSPIFISIGTICGGLFPKMYRGQIAMDVLPSFPVNTYKLVDFPLLC